VKKAWIASQWLAMTGSGLTTHQFHKMLD